MQYVMYAVLLFFMFNISSDGNKSAGEMLTAAVVATAIATIGQMFAKRARRKKQDGIDEAARNILEEVRAGRKPSEEFILFIRPFFVTGSLDVKNGFRSSGALAPSNMFQEEQYAVDEMMRWRSGLPVVKIGRLTEEVGGGTIQTGDDWSVCFDALVDAASYVVAVPFASPSTRWEVRELVRRGHLAKTVFFLPSLGNASGKVKDDSHWLRANAERLWAYSRTVFARDGIVFPDVPVDAAFVVHRQTGKADGWSAAPLDKKTIRFIGKRAFPNRQPSDPSLADDLSAFFNRRRFEKSSKVSLTADEVDEIRRKIDAIKERFVAAVEQARQMEQEMERRNAASPLPYV